MDDGKPVTGARVCGKMAMMKVQFVDIQDGVVVERGNVFDVLGIDGGWYRIIDDMGDSCLIPPQYLEVIEENPAPPVYDSSRDPIPA